MKMVQTQSYQHRQDSQHKQVNLWQCIHSIWRRGKMRMALSRRRCSCLFGWFMCLLVLLYVSGMYQYLLAWSYSKHYTHWGPLLSLDPIMEKIRAGEEVAQKPVTEFTHTYIHSNTEKCETQDSIRLMYVVKSAAENFDKRKGIRNSWGFEGRFSDVEIRTVFLLGAKPSEPYLQERIDKEAEEYKDIIQADFIDSYFNNTLKAMMGLHWTYQHCQYVKYFLFIDDDYYVSTRNMLRFLRDPANYPQYLEKYVVSAVNEYKDFLYAGYVFNDSRPIRWIFNKWYVSLEEYPYSHWPPYVTAGAYVLSRKSLEYLYIGSLYTNYFRFDDIFLGMAAKKAGLTPFHHREFYFDKKPYSKENYKWVIASHGFDDPGELQNVWSEQRSAGNT
ncbi:beta-1,3-galactosyltransferase brn-like [Penaeus japonicus]|uniref:beta-1,3-galactosyltransferase brn-like n=1 Tax=Penaeus japonicus TaxID=27405 RepID=UPI001C70D5B4|nr:beta-1,3-galactosyltransferase brn-like [Penaeus japonicus]